MARVGSSEAGAFAKGAWKYRYRAVDKTGQTIDFLLTEQRDEHAAQGLVLST
jgi:transposase-like protein